MDPMVPFVTGFLLSSIHKAGGTVSIRRIGRIEPDYFIVTLTSGKRLKVSVAEVKVSVAEAPWDEADDIVETLKERERRGGR